MTLQEIIPIIDLSIGPVIMISGIGLVLLSMTNRYGRVIDRSRQLYDLIQSEHLRDGPEEEVEHHKEQLEILADRAKLLRYAIALASFSLLLAALLIVCIFLIALLDVNGTVMLITVFISCMLCLIIGLIVFIIDINTSFTSLIADMDL